MKIALAQINSFVGDIENNSNHIIKRAKEASKKGVELFITPELSICGYPPEDLVLRKDFVDACSKALKKIAKALPFIKVIVGHPLKKGSKIYNGASLLFKGKIQGTYFKQTLPNYGVFDENRYFESGDKEFIFTHKGLKIALLICEDAWSISPNKLLKKKLVDGIVVINASPYEIEKSDIRIKVISKLAKETKSTVIYLNAIGGQDELIFDGGSFIINKEAKLLHQLPFFKEETAIIDVFSKTSTKNNIPKAPYSKEAHLYEALKLALKDYVVKNNFKNLFIGLSGGIDSAIVASIAVDALGAEKVYGVGLPSKYSSDHSISDAEDLALRTGLNWRIVPIEPMVNEFVNNLGLTGLAEENVQARVRGTTLMGISNQEGHLVLATGNKSELAVGYSTMYGDAVGGFAPIKDIYKTQVWQLARWRNELAIYLDQIPPIPESSITKDPSAELRPNQKDTDSLPDYILLDQLLVRYVDGDEGAASLIAGGFGHDLVNRVITLVDRAEYKRRQYPPGTKISSRAFGKDRRLPVTSRWREQ